MAAMHVTLILQVGNQAANLKIHLAHLSPHLFRLSVHSCVGVHLGKIDFVQQASPDTPRKKSRGLCLQSVGLPADPVKQDGQQIKSKLEVLGVSCRQQAVVGVEASCRSHFRTIVSTMQLSIVRGRRAPWVTPHCAQKMRSYNPAVLQQKMQSLQITTVGQTVFLPTPVV